MAFKAEFTNLSQRLNELVAQLEETARSRKLEESASRGGRIIEIIFRNLRELFTHGVTKEELRDLIRHETRETFKFYSQHVDFDALQTLPKHKRYPLAAWKFFIATAYRLSPPRRIAFAVATIAFLMGAIQFVLVLSASRTTGSGVLYWFLAIGIFFLLLLMELRDKLDLKGDLEIAREIQVGLVPSRPYQRNAIAIHSRMRPANTVGGDYHDIIDLDESLVGIVVGDVAGKGMPAALLMALLQGSLRTLITAKLRGPELIKELNEYLFDNIPANRLVTLFYGELNTKTGALRYINAGHNAPFIMRPGQALERLPSTALVLGVVRDSIFAAAETHLNPQDQLLLFTDGISEAFDAREEEYGEERLAEFLQNHIGLGQEALISGIINDALSFCGHTRPGDDMTVMSVLRNS